MRGEIPADLQALCPLPIPVDSKSPELSSFMYTTHVHLCFIVLGGSLWSCLKFSAFSYVPFWGTFLNFPLLLLEVLLDLQVATLPN